MRPCHYKPARKKLCNMISISNLKHSNYGGIDEWWHHDRRHVCRHYLISYRLRMHYYRRKHACRLLVSQVEITITSRELHYVMRKFLKAPNPKQAVISRRRRSDFYKQFTACYVNSRSPKQHLEICNKSFSTRPIFEQKFKEARPVVVTIPSISKMKHDRN